MLRRYYDSADILNTDLEPPDNVKKKSNLSQFKQYWNNIIARQLHILPETISFTCKRNHTTKEKNTHLHEPDSLPT